MSHIGSLPIAIALLAVSVSTSIAQTSPLPAQGIAGQWTNDVQMNASSSDSTVQNFWVGRLWGRIDPTGKMFFKADNGCTVLGLATPTINAWKATVQLTGCSYAALNRQYEAYIYLTGGMLSFRATTGVIGPGRSESYQLNSTLSRY